MTREHEELGLLSAFLDDELAPVERAALSSHLESCDACSGELSELRGVKSFLGSSARREMPSGLRAALAAEIRASGLFQFLRRAFAPARLLVPAGAAAMLAAFVWALSDRAELPLEPLLAAHSRYSVEALVSQDDLSHPDFLADLRDLHGAD